MLKRPVLSVPIFVASLVTVSLLALLARSGGVQEIGPVQADHTGTGMSAMSIDMDADVGGPDENTATSVGSRQDCQRVNENNTLDADETSTDTVTIDVTARGIPPYHDSGTPGDPNDDTGAMIAYSFALNYDEANLTLQSQDIAFLIGSNPGSSTFDASQPLPDTDGNNTWIASVADLGLPPGSSEDGDGVLSRLMLSSDAGATPGVYDLTLTNNAHIDIENLAYAPLITDDATVAIDTICDRDGDGVADAIDNCPATANANQADSDTDGRGDVCDFPDVPNDHWSLTYVQALFDSEITSGFLDGTYRPNDNVTRAQMAKFIVIAMGEEGNLQPYQGHFPDVPDGVWYALYVERLKDLGVTSGFLDGTYRPANNVTRAQMAKFILIAIGQQNSLPGYQGYFPDVPDGEWYTGYVERLSELNIAGGFLDGTYRPNNNVTRAQMAKFIVLAWNIPLA